MSDMEKLAGSGRQVILFDSFEDLTKRIVEEFKSKSRGKFGLLRKEQPLQHTRHIVCYIASSFPGSLFSAFLGRWKKDPGCGWSRYHPEAGWQKNLLVGRGGRVFFLVDVTDFVDFKSSSSRL